ncbi:putative membrane protein [Anoxybacillus sp. B7M1]|uniref:hypothetical protein n=1 Tax=unclassified Anoxybacillus TaxID=2639704 RepID=UPI0007983301|nr:MULTISPECIES: hypothetical protein [unclassified Anoxybacillus]ANB59137.1 putative membrane protein [Anoxybacillus sp. B2M1]ANB63012.1 putative membrane protein [Anoxybacillus sp. B7M1]KXG10921.1 hypothetical protein AT864_00789 [Anoxybacillus sp. P3H1B]OQM47003.1 hypothetical protein B6A27_03360 [Anoxybacillus sp. UARK-01]
MSKLLQGLICVLMGFIFFMLSLTLSMPTILWSVLLGASIIMNMAGTAILLRYMKKTKESI